MPPYELQAESLSSSRHDSSSSKTDSYVTTKNALDRMEASIQVVVDYLAGEGVSKASQTELWRDFSKGNYVAVMELCQDYAKCVYAAREKHQDTKIVLFLLLNAWESLAVYLCYQYQQSHRYYHTLRRTNAKAVSELQKALQRKVELAEQCTASQKGYLLAQAWERQCAVKTC